MGHKHKEDHIESFPGPGNYNPNFETVQKKLPKWVYKNRLIKKDWIKNVKAPGPG